MKKRGFTLVELLAVIVVLAVIALIATPIILNIVDGVKKDAKKASARGYVKAVETAILNEKMKNDDVDYAGDYTINGSTLKKIDSEQASLLTGIAILDSTTLNVSVKGDAPKTGTLTIDDNDDVSKAEFYYSDYVVTLNNKGEYAVQILTSGGASSADIEALENRIQTLESKVTTLEQQGGSAYDVLYSGSAETVGSTYNLSKNISDYKYLIIYSQIKQPNVPEWTKAYSSSVVVDTASISYTNSTYTLNAFYNTSSWYYCINISFLNDTSFKINEKNSVGFLNPKIDKIVGVK